MKIRPGEASDVIVDTHKTRAKAAEAEKARPEGKGIAAGKAEGLAEDKVDVSATRQITELLKGFDSKDRVAHFKALIEAGKYNPASETVAKSLADALDEEIKFDKLLSPVNDGDKDFETEE